MSGTLNKSMLDEIVLTFALNSNWVLIHQNLNLRNWDSICVKDCQSTGQHLVLDAVNLLKSNVLSESNRQRRPLRIMVFAYSVKLAGLMFDLLRKDVHLKEFVVSLVMASSTKEDLKQAISNYSSEEMPGYSTILVSTSILTVGVNLRKVSHVFVFGTHSIVELIQAWSRADRTGKNGKVWLLQPSRALENADYAAVNNGGLLNQEEISKSLEFVSEEKRRGILSILGWKSVAPLLHCDCVIVCLEKMFVLEEGSAGLSIRCGKCSACKCGNSNQDDVVEMPGSPTKKSRIGGENTQQPSSTTMLLNNSSSSSNNGSNSGSNSNDNQVLVDEPNYQQFNGLYRSLISAVIVGREACCLCCGEGKNGCNPNECAIVSRFAKLFPACYWCGNKHHRGNESRNLKECCFPISNSVRCYLCMRENCANKGRGGGDSLCKTYATYRNILFVCWFHEHTKLEMKREIKSCAKCGSFVEFFNWATQKTFAASSTIRRNLDLVVVFYLQRRNRY